MLQSAKPVEFMDPEYSVYSSDSDFSSSILRFSYTTLKTPLTDFDYDMCTGVAVAKRFRHFQTSLLPLLDRDFVYVIAHVRGGGELGKQWSENGKLLKKNTFLDFIACAEYLIELSYSTKEKLVIDGPGAGGLLINAVINMRLDLFKAAIAEEPFLDVLTTLLDQTIPDIKSQWEEWGDPHKEEFYYYIKSYSPVDNVSAQKYPSILVTSGLNYYIPCSDSAKFVAKWRDLKIDENLSLLKCELSDGTSANSGRFDYLKQDAFKFTFILKALNMVC